MECTEAPSGDGSEQHQSCKIESKSESDNESVSKTQTKDDDKLHGENGEEKQPTLTKTQMKKLKKKEKWEQVKAGKRKAEKERYKARKRACLERGEEVGPTRKQLKRNKMSKSNCKVQVVVDCDFDQYMAEKDIKMLVKQIQFSYSANRRAENPMQFHCCGISGKTKQRLESLGDYKGWDSGKTHAKHILQANSVDPDQTAPSGTLFVKGVNMRHYKINFHSEGYLDLFDKASVVYLSSESPNILSTLADDKVYIIGGLVDHNHEKGLCHRLAEEKGVAHAQLPISDYIDMKTRKVLTINHVFEILLNYTETRDWQKSFYKVLPPRKGAIPKSKTCSDKGDNSSDNVRVDSSEQTTAESVKEQEQGDSDNEHHSSCCKPDDQHKVSEDEKVSEDKSKDQEEVSWDKSKDQEEVSEDKSEDQEEVSGDKSKDLEEVSKDKSEDQEEVSGDQTKDEEMVSVTSDNTLTASEAVEHTSDDERDGEVERT